MYQEFKRKLLDEMETRRDTIVVQSSETSLEPIFEISSSDDKLYKRILDEFDKIFMRHAEDLLFELCEKYNIKAYPGPMALFDMVMEIDGQECFVELKTSLRTVNSNAWECMISSIHNSKVPVYIVYLYKDNPNGRRAIASQKYMIEKRITQNDETPVRVELTLFEEFLAKLFGEKELSLFREAMSTYKEELHKTIGFQITEIFNEFKLSQLKTELDRELVNFRYDEIKNSKDEELYSRNYNEIKEQYLNRNRYKLLLGESNFAESFLTSEWLYRNYFSLEELDNTFIVTGYLKSIEQLLWNIIFIIGQGRQIGGVTIEEGNVDDIDKTLGSLEWFIKDYNNQDLFETAFGNSTRYVMNYLGNQLTDWRKRIRNGYFHKDNLKNRETIDEIRSETLYLYMLILGTIALDEDTISRLSQR